MATPARALFIPFHVSSNKGVATSARKEFLEEFPSTMPVHRKCFLPQISQHGQFPFLPRGMNVRSKQGSFLPFSTFLPLQGTITINHLIVFFFVIIPCLYCVSRRAVVLAQINWKSHVPFSSCACRLTWNCPYLLSVYRRLLLLNHDDGGQIFWTN